MGKLYRRFALAVKQNSENPNYYLSAGLLRDTACVRWHARVLLGPPQAWPATQRKLGLAVSGQRAQLQREPTRMASPFYTAEHEAYRDVVRRFVEKEIAPFAHEGDEAGGVPRELYEKAAAIGLLGLRTARAASISVEPEPGEGDAQISNVGRIRIDVARPRHDRTCKCQPGQIRSCCPGACGNIALEQNAAFSFAHPQGQRHRIQRNGEVTQRGFADHVGQQAAKLQGAGLRKQDTQRGGGT